VLYVRLKELTIWQGELRTVRPYYRAGRHLETYLGRFTGISSNGSTDENGNNTGNNTSSKKTNIGPIIGGVVGGIAVLAILGFVIFWFCIRKRKKPAQPVTNFSPNNPPMGQTQVPQVYNNPNPGMMPNTNPQSYPYPINQPVLNHASSSWSGNEPLLGGTNNQSNPGSVGTSQYMNMAASNNTGTNPNNNNQQQGGYYNYVPPPMENSVTGIASDRSNYSVTPAPTFQTTAASSSHPSQTPSPPPTSAYAPWAIPMDSATTASSSPPPNHFEQMASGTVVSEKAQYSARDEKAQFSGFRPNSGMSGSTRLQSPAPPYQPHLMGGQ
jgi:hypothetical protein